MKIVNPLYYPLAVLVAALLLVLGVRGLQLPRGLMLPVAAGVAIVGASLLQASKPNPLGLDHSELERELQQVQQQAKDLAARADELRIEADRLLTRAHPELLGTVQYACDRAAELPLKVDQLRQRMQGSGSLLSVADLQQQQQKIAAQLSQRSGMAKEQLMQLAERLQRNIELAQQGEDTRYAQVVNVSILIQEAAGLLQALQNKLRSSDVTNLTDAIELQSLSDELKTVQENVDDLVWSNGSPL